MPQHTFKKPSHDFEVNYRKLERIIRDYFGKPEFNFLDHMYDVANDTMQDVEVGETLGIWYQSDVWDWMNGKDNQVYIEHILTTIAAQDVIPSGLYLIEISW